MASALSFDAKVLQATRDGGSAFNRLSQLAYDADGKLTMVRKGLGEMLEALKSADDIATPPTMPPPAPNDDDDCYARCLYCNAPYGKSKSEHKNVSDYKNGWAACGCRGVGSDCWTGARCDLEGFRNAQCGMGANSKAKCYKCRQADLKAAEPERK